MFKAAWSHGWEAKIKDGRMDKLKAVLPKGTAGGELQGNLGAISGGFGALSALLATDKREVPEDQVKKFPL